MSRIDFTVDGMHCDGCSARLKRVLEAGAGIHHARIVLESRQAHVDFDAQATDQDAIRELIAGAGFCVVSCRAVGAG